MNQFSKEAFAQQYQYLQSQDIQVKQQANQYILDYQKSKQSWEINQEMLIHSQEQTFIFLGSQMLSKKIKYEYNKGLDKQQQNSLRDFVFNYIFSADNNQINNKMAKKQLCQGAAIIAIWKLLDDCPNFINDLVTKLMVQSEINVLFGLEILERIPQEFNETMIDKRSQIAIKQLLVDNNSQNIICLNQMFLEILCNNQEKLIEKGLDALLSWIQSFKYQLLENQTLVIQLLQLLDKDISSIISEKTGEVLTQGINQSKSADLHQTCQMTNISKQFQIISWQSLQKILTYLTSGRIQTDPRTESSYIRSVAEILVMTCNKMPIIILQGDQQSRSVISLMVTLLAHQNLQYSLIIFDFFNCFKNIIQDLDNKSFLQETSYDYIFEAYSQCQTIVMDKCQQKYRQKQHFIGIVKQTENGQVIVERQTEQVQEQTDLQEDINEYRQYSEDLFFNIFHVLSAFRGEQGIAIYYQQVMKVLSLDMYVSTECLVKDYLLGIESGLFCMTGVVDHPSNDSTYLNQLLQMVLHILPKDPIIVKTALQLIYNSTNQYTPSLTLTLSLFTYILHFITHHQLQVLSAQCLLSICEYTSTHNTQEVFHLLITFVRDNLHQVQDKNVLENILQSVFHYALNFQERQTQVYAMQECMTILTNILVNLINQPAEQFIAILNIIIAALLTFNLADQQQQYLIQEVLQPFLNHNLSHILQAFKHFIQIDKLPIVFNQFIKLVVKLLNLNTVAYFESILELTFLIFQQNIKNNSLVLQVFGLIINVLEKNQQFQNWLHQNYDKVNGLLINAIYTTQDPEIIQNFIKIQQNIISSSCGLLLKSQFYNQIIEVSIKSFKIIEYNLQRELFNFFKTLFVSNIKNKNAILEEYFKIFFEVFPEFSTTLILKAVEVLQIIYEYFLNQDQYVTQLIRVNLNGPLYSKFLNEREQQLITQFIEYKYKETKQLKLMLYDLSNYLNEKNSKEFLVDVEIKLSNIKLKPKNNYNQQSVRIL